LFGSFYGGNINAEGQSLLGDGEFTDQLTFTMVFIIIFLMVVFSLSLPFFLVSIPGRTNLLNG